MARLAERIRQARRQSGLSQEALAERIGVPPDRLRGYEEGATVTARQLELIAVATGRPLSYFVDGAEPARAEAGGLRGRLRSALAWLSETSGPEPAAEARLAEVIERERRFEHALEAERTKTAALEAKVAELTARLQMSDALAEREAALGAREAAVEAREEVLGRQARLLEAREADLEQLRAALEERAREPEARHVAEPGSYDIATLERLVAEREQDFPERAEEWRAYLVFLREFAHGDGRLPPSFNTLVREVFRELVP